jgi:hypothetical protein
MFTYRIISDGPHRVEKIYLVTGPALFTSGQLHFNERRSMLPAQSERQVEADGMPPLRFIFESGTTAQ